MPELPEVETVRSALAREITGKTIAEVVLRREGLRTPFPAGCAGKMRGARILAVERRAKYLLWRLDNGHTVILHLGMSGRFNSLTALPDIFHKHDHVAWRFTDGTALLFNDARRFGLLDITETGSIEHHPLLAHLGPEPLSPDFSAAYLKKALAARRVPVKVALMDQALVVGAGNIYASEALFLAGVDPRIPAFEAAGKAAVLVKAVQKVLREAIESGGSSLRDFMSIDGQTGYFQHRFNVYGREDAPCVRCGSAIQRVTQAGRSSFFCGKCQSYKGKTLA